MRGRRANQAGKTRVTQIRGIGKVKIVRIGKIKTFGREKKT